MVAAIGLEYAGGIVVEERAVAVNRVDAESPGRAIGRMKS